MTFSTTIEREDTGKTHSLTVHASVQLYADAIGCPAEQRGRYSGAVEVELLEVTDDDTGVAFELTSEERRSLEQEAVEQSVAW